MLQRNIRRRATAAGVATLSVLAFLIATAGPAAAATPTPPFNQCPPVGVDTSCRVLFYINPSGSLTTLQDLSQPPYELSEDSLVGVQNDGPTPLSVLHLSAPGVDIFGFDGDGLCDVDPHPAGCPFGPTGYEGPGVTFTNISPNADSGDVNFNPPIPANGGSGYFSLEEDVTAATFAMADKSLTKTGFPGAFVGSPLIYSISVTNNGPDTDGDVVVTDTLPTGVTFLSATPSQGTCTQTGVTVTCDLGTMASGDSATIQVAVLATTAGVLTNTACVSGAASDPDATNDCASVDTVVITTGGGGGGGGGGGQGPGNCTIVGNTGPNTLFGTPHHDVICGLAGNDVIHAGAGNDKVFGGKGNDTLYGGPGKDKLFGGPGKDTCFPKGPNGPSHSC